MPDINQIKEFLCSAYPGNRWKKKVDHMSDMQLIAVWSRLRNKNKEPPKIECKSLNDDSKSQGQEHQLTLFDDF